MLRSIIFFLAKRLWKKIHPTYTRDVLRLKKDEAYKEVERCIKEGDCWGATTARRKAAQYQLKILRIAYLEDITLIKEECKIAKAQKKVRKR